MIRASDTKSAKVIKYFMKHPSAKPDEVAAMFGVSLGNVYAYRKRAAAERASTKEAEVFFSKKTVDEALTEPVAKDVALGLAIATAQRWKEEVAPQVATVTDSWLGYGQFLSRDEYRGYLRGRVVDLMRGGLQGNFDEAMRCADKLTQLAKSEG